MRFISLFTGVGGLDLGLERAGWECVAQVENDEWCTRILNKHWPTVPKWRNIYDVTAEDLPHADAIVGGFPCQPVSLAGKRRAQDDERWLWPEFLRIVRAIRPSIVLVENVPGLFSAGFGDVIGGLAEAGYDTEWASVPAAAVGAPHLRWRVFIVAYPVSSGVEPDTGVRRRDAGESSTGTRPSISRGEEVAFAGDAVTRCADVADTNDVRRDGWTREQRPAGRRESTDGSHKLADADDTGLQGRGEEHGLREDREEGETGWGSWWSVEPDVGRVAYGVPRRVDRLRGLGNAVVPQVAEWIGRRISNTIGVQDG